MKRFLRFLAFLSTLLAALMAYFLGRKNRLPKDLPFVLPKLFSGALAPAWGLAGAAGGLLGLLSGAPLSALLGGWGAYTAWNYLQKVTRAQGGIEKAFGPNWKTRISPEQANRLLSFHWDWSLPAEPEPRWQRDLAFATLENGRQLLCDLWLPAEGVKPSGLAVLYFHGSGWYLLDKDFGTRTLFRHLAAQGHAVMDVAYRLAPEASMAEMVGDVKRALAWMKAHAGEYNADPHKVVLMGSSAGGHLALLAGFAPNHPQMTPPELQGADLAARAVVSFYGPCDLSACYFHTRQDVSTGHLSAPLVIPPADPHKAAQMRQQMGERFERLGFHKDSLLGTFLHLLGGHPGDVPELYSLFSPITHIHPGCPPVFLAQGEDDLITPVGSTLTLADKLRAAGVPTACLVMPQTEHAFELAAPRFNPAARVAFFELDRFLALVA